MFVFVGDYFFQVVANNDSFFSKAAIKVWNLVEDAKTLPIETLVDTLTKRETQKLQLDCTECQTDDEVCNCTFQGIMSENTFNIDLIIKNQNNLKWCPSKSVTSSLFHCDIFHSINSSMLCDGYRDCPNGLDETLGLCRPDEPLYVIPVLSLYVTSFCLAIFFVSCRKQKISRSDSEPAKYNSNPFVTRALKDVGDF